MARRRLPFALVAALAFGAVFAGCTSDTSGTTGGPLSQSATDDTGGPVDPGQTDPVEPGVTPTTQASSRVKVDPNATFEGAAHMHDWWGAQTELVIMDRDLELPAGGVCVGEPLTFGCNGAPEKTKFIRFESDPDPQVRPNIVYQGTGEMVVRVTVGQVLAPFALNTYAPKIPFDSMRLVVDQASKTFTIAPINDSQTDPPHVRTSSWYWRLESHGSPKGALFRGPLHIEVIVKRDPNRALPVDPPHPDHWNGTTSKVLIEKTTKHQSTANGVTYPLYAYDTGNGCAGNACRFTITPEVNRTVPIATGRVEVTLKWNNAASSTNTKAMLEYCAPPENCLYTSATWTRVPAAEDGATQRKFVISVREDQWDSPYTLESAKGAYSKWSFRWSAESSNPGSLALFQGDMSWYVEVFKIGS